MDENISTDPRLIEVYQTIIASPISSVEELLDEYPSVINFRVWQGISLLHQICMRGTDENVVSVLVGRGADVNCRTQLGETPLHYACRKGSLPIISLLLKHGAEPKAVDNAGHTCMHYAAQGNSVVVMDYLNDVLSLAYDDKSSAQQTPLHVAALHGNWQVVAYLLKKKRCDAFSADIMGNTALHLAAMRGEAIICCQLVTKVGKKILEMNNSQSESPLQIAKAGTTTAHRATEKWLKSPNTAPVMLWISKLTLPSIVGCLLPILLNYLWPSSQPYYWGCVVLIVGYWLNQQQHRLSHPSRWSNPARAGLYAWGILSNTILYFSCLMEVTRSYWIVTWLSWTSLFLITFSLATFYYTPPGVYVGESKNWSDLERRVTGSAFCDECEIIQKVGVRHCRICGNCYRLMQHHCLFLLRCVTHANERYFTLILLANVFSCLTYILNVVVYLQQKWDEEFRVVDHVWMLILFVADFICVGCTVMLIKLQVTDPYAWPRKHKPPNATFTA